MKKRARPRCSLRGIIPLGRGEYSIHLGVTQLEQILAVSGGNRRAASAYVRLWQGNRVTPNIVSSLARFNGKISPDCHASTGGNPDQYHNAEVSLFRIRMAAVSLLHLSCVISESRFTMVCNAEGQKHGNRLVSPYNICFGCLMLYSWRDLWPCLGP